jgi:mannose-1-phosphate guanylyltransferase/mannose-6-phosphate isomerase
LSRELYPKQFLKILGTSLFQDTLLRCLEVSDISEIFVVTNLLEPDGKNTLPAIGFAVREIETRFGDSTVGVFSSDHILDTSAMQTIAGAEKLADDHLVTFGITPRSPHTGYGYIKPGDALDMGYEVSEFKEKPDMEHAKQYVESGYLWNSGMFLFGTGFGMSFSIPTGILKISTIISRAYRWITA